MAFPAGANAYAIKYYNKEYEQMLYVSSTVETRAPLISCSMSFWFGSNLDPWRVRWLPLSLIVAVDMVLMGLEDIAR
eukprot:6178785-Pleurochrysis_carterae.AAC.2